MTPENEEKTDESEEDRLTIEAIENSKYVEFYSQSYASFYNTTMEKDKSILTVSAGGIGFLITFINISKNLEFYQYIIFLFAALAFIVAIFTVIHIFGKNAEYIISVTSDAEDTALKEGKLVCLDKTAIIAFSLGIILSLILGITSSYKNIKQEPAMSTKEESSQNTTQTTTCTDSVAGAATLKKSFTGATSLKPQPTSQTSNTNTNGQNQAKKD